MLKASETIAQNLNEISPDLFTTVPRLLEKVYEKIMQKGSELTGIKRKLFFWAQFGQPVRDQQKTRGFLQHAIVHCKQTYF